MGKLKVKDAAAVTAMNNLVSALSSHVSAYDAHKHAIKMATFAQRELKGVAGGTATAGSWFDISLTELSDVHGLITITSNRIKFPTAGTYFLWCAVPGLACGHFQARVYDYTGSTEYSIGQSTYSNYANAYAQVNSIIACFLYPLANREYKIQMRVSNTKTSSGRGTPADFTVEQYTTGWIIQINTDVP